MELPSAFFRKYPMAMRPRDFIPGFVDELTKIAIVSEQLPVQSIPSQLVTTSLTDPLNSWSKTPDWKKNSPNSEKKPPSKGKAEQNSLPAREANKVFFRPEGGPKTQSTRFKSLPDDGSAAKQMNRDGSPIDAQSTANVASSNMIAPASGPGGV
jgi:hypothetical protein